MPPATILAGLAFGGSMATILALLQTRRKKQRPCDHCRSSHGQSAYEHGPPVARGSLPTIRLKCSHTVKEELSAAPSPAATVILPNP